MELYSINTTTILHKSMVTVHLRLTFMGKILQIINYFTSVVPKLLHAMYSRHFMSCQVPPTPRTAYNNIYLYTATAAKHVDSYWG